MTGWRHHVVLGTALLVVGVCYTGLAFGSVVMNGTTSLPHNGYFMLRLSLAYPRGSYVVFDAPDVVAAEFKSLSFVKRVVGTAGDAITVDGNRVCIQGQCRQLQADLVAKGIGPLAQRLIPQGQVAVFGDAENSLDSRYAVIGLVHVDKIHGVGWPIPIPNWKVVRTWLDR